MKRDILDFCFSSLSSGFGTHTAQEPLSINDQVNAVGKGHRRVKDSSRHFKACPVSRRVLGFWRIITVLTTNTTWEASPHFVGEAVNILVINSSTKYGCKRGPQSFLNIPSSHRTLHRVSDLQNVM